MKGEDSAASDDSEQSLHIDWREAEHQQDVDIYADLPDEGDVGNDFEHPASSGGRMQTSQEKSEASNTFHQESSKAIEDEIDDMIIQTHSYGGVTVTTKTPRSMCNMSQSPGEGDEYDPFSSDIMTGEDDSSRKCSQESEESSPCSFPDNAKATSHKSSLDSKYDVTYGYGYPETKDSDAAYSYDLPEEYTPGAKEKDFKDYSQGASYSYSESTHTESEKQFAAYNDYAPSGADLVVRKEQSAVSKSKSAIIRNDVKHMDTRTAVHSKHADVKTASKQNLKGAEKSKNPKVSLKPGQEKSGNAKVVSKKVVKPNSQKQKVVSAVKKDVVTSNKEPKLSKTTTAASSLKVKKEVQSTEKSKPVHSEKKSISKKVIIDGKAQKSVKDTVNKTDVKSKTKVVDASNSKKVDTSKSTSKPLDNEEAKTKEKSKAKVSSEELSNFFKKRQELKAAKPNIKGLTSQKDNVTRTSSSDPKKVEHLKTKKMEHQKAKGSDHGDSVKGKLVPMPKSATSKHHVQKSNDNDRSLFKSFEKPLTKKAQTTSVQECAIDIFAIATDDTSSDDDLDDTEEVLRDAPKPKPKTAIASKSTSSSSSKPPLSKPKLVQKRTNSDDSHAKKRPASPTRHADSKRLRKSSTSLSRQESTKIVEIDLFGDDSDEDSLPEINLVTDSEEEKVSKTPRKSPVSSNVKEKSVHSKLSSSGKVSVGNISKTIEKSKRGLKPFSEKSAGNFLPTPKKKPSTIVSSASSSTKNVKTYLKPKSINGKDRTQKEVSVDKKLVKVESMLGSGHGHRDHTNPMNTIKSGHKKVSHHDVYISSSDDELPDVLTASNDDDDDDDDGQDDQSNYNHERNMEDVLDRHGNSQAYNDDYDSDTYMEDMKKFLEESSEEEEDTFDECYRIFQEDHGEARSVDGHKQKVLRDF